MQVPLHTGTSTWFDLAPGSLCTGHATQRVQTQTGHDSLPPLSNRLHNVSVRPQAVSLRYQGLAVVVSVTLNEQGGEQMGSVTCEARMPPQCG